MTEQEKTRPWRKRVIRKLAGVAAMWVKPAPTGPTEPVGEDMPPQALHLPKDEWVTEMDVKYGDDEYRLVEKNGELRLERVENA